MDNNSGNEFYSGHSPSIMRSYKRDFTSQSPPHVRGNPLRQDLRNKSQFNSHDATAASLPNISNIQYDAARSDSFIHLQDIDITAVYPLTRTDNATTSFLNRTGNLPLPPIPTPVFTPPASPIKSPRKDNLPRLLELDEQEAVKDNMQVDGASSMFKSPITRLRVPPESEDPFTAAFSPRTVSTNALFSSKSPRSTTTVVSLVQDAIPRSVPSLPSAHHSVLLAAEPISPSATHTHSVPRNTISLPATTITATSCPASASSSSSPAPLTAPTQTQKPLPPPLPSPTDAFLTAFAATSPRTHAQRRMSSPSSTAMASTLPSSSSPPSSSTPSLALTAAHTSAKPAHGAASILASTTATTTTTATSISTPTSASASASRTLPRTRSRSRSQAPTRPLPVPPRTATPAPVPSRLSPSSASSSSSASYSAVPPTAASPSAFELAFARTSPVPVHAGALDPASPSYALPPASSSATTAADQRTTTTNTTTNAAIPLSAAVSPPTSAPASAPTSTSAASASVAAVDVAAMVEATVANTVAALTHGQHLHDAQHTTQTYQSHAEASPSSSSSPASSPFPAIQLRFTSPFASPFASPHHGNNTGAASASASISGVDVARAGVDDQADEHADSEAYAGDGGDGDAYATYSDYYLDNTHTDNAYPPNAHAYATDGYLAANIEEEDASHGNVYVEYDDDGDDVGVEVYNTTEDQIDADLENMLALARDLATNGYNMTTNRKPMTTIHGLSTHDLPKPSLLTSTAINSHPTVNSLYEDADTVSNSGDSMTIFPSHIRVASPHAPTPVTAKYWAKKARAERGHETYARKAHGRGGEIHVMQQQSQDAGEEGSVDVEGEPSEGNGQAWEEEREPVEQQYLYDAESGKQEKRESTGVPDAAHAEQTQDYAQELPKFKKVGANASLWGDGTYSVDETVHNSSLYTQSAMSVGSHVYYIASTEHHDDNMDNGDDNHSNHEDNVDKNHVKYDNNIRENAPSFTPDPDLTAVLGIADDTLAVIDARLLALSSPAPHRLLYSPPPLPPLPHTTHATQMVSSTQDMRVVQSTHEPQLPHMAQPQNQTDRAPAQQMQTGMQAHKQQQIEADLQTHTQPSPQIQTRTQVQPYIHTQRQSPLLLNPDTSSSHLTESETPSGFFVRKTWEEVSDSGNTTMEFPPRNFPKSGNGMYAGSVDLASASSSLSGLPPPLPTSTNNITNNITNNMSTHAASPFLPVSGTATLPTPRSPHLLRARDLHAQARALRQMQRAAAAEVMVVAGGHAQERVRDVLQEVLKRWWHVACGMRAEERGRQEEQQRKREIRREQVGKGIEMLENILHRHRETRKNRQHARKIPSSHSPTTSTWFPSLISPVESVAHVYVDGWHCRVPLTHAVAVIYKWQVRATRAALVQTEGTLPGHGGATDAVYREEAHVQSGEPQGVATAECERGGGDGVGWAPEASTREQRGGSAQEGRRDRERSSGSSMRRESSTQEKHTTRNSRSKIPEARSSSTASSSTAAPISPTTSHSTLHSTSSPSPADPFTAAFRRATHLLHTQPVLPLPLPPSPITIAAQRSAATAASPPPPPPSGRSPTASFSSAANTNANTATTTAPITTISTAATTSASGQREVSSASAAQPPLSLPIPPAPATHTTSTTSSSSSFLCPPPSPSSASCAPCPTPPSYLRHTAASRARAQSPVSPTRSPPSPPRTSSPRTSPPRPSSPSTLARTRTSTHTRRDHRVASPAPRKYTDADNTTDSSTRDTHTATVTGRERVRTSTTHSDVWTDMRAQSPQTQAPPSTPGSSLATVPPHPPLFPLPVSALTLPLHPSSPSFSLPLLLDRAHQIILDSALSSFGAALTPTLAHTHHPHLRQVRLVLLLNLAHRAALLHTVHVQKSPTKADDGHPTAPATTTSSSPSSSNTHDADADHTNAADRSPHTPTRRAFSPSSLPFSPTTRCLPPAPSALNLPPLPQRTLSFLSQFIAHTERAYTALSSRPSTTPPPTHKHLLPLSHLHSCLRYICIRHPSAPLHGPAQQMLLDALAPPALIALTMELHKHNHTNTNTNSSSGSDSHSNTTATGSHATLLSPEDNTAYLRLLSHYPHLAYPFLAPDTLLYVCITHLFPCLDAIAAHVPVDTYTPSPSAASSCSPASSPSQYSRSRALTSPRSPTRQTHTLTCEQLHACIYKYNATLLPLAQAQKLNLTSPKKQKKTRVLSSPSRSPMHARVGRSPSSPDPHPVSSASASSLSTSSTSSPPTHAPRHHSPRRSHTHTRRRALPSPRASSPSSSSSAAAAAGPSPFPSPPPPPRSPRSPTAMRSPRPLPQHINETLAHTHTPPRARTQKHTRSHVKAGAEAGVHAHANAEVDVHPLSNDSFFAHELTTVLPSPTVHDTSLASSPLLSSVLSLPSVAADPPHPSLCLDDSITDTIAFTPLSHGSSPSRSRVLSKSAHDSSITSRHLSFSTSPSHTQQQQQQQRQGRSSPQPQSQSHSQTNLRVHRASHSPDRRAAVSSSPHTRSTTNAASNTTTKHTHTNTNTIHNSNSSSTADRGTATRPAHPTKSPTDLPRARSQTHARTRPSPSPAGRSRSPAVSSGHTTIPTATTPVPPSAPAATTSASTSARAAARANFASLTSSRSPPRPARSSPHVALPSPPSPRSRRSSPVTRHTHSSTSAASASSDTPSQSSTSPSSRHSSTHASKSRHRTASPNAPPASFLAPPSSPSPPSARRSPRSPRPVRATAAMAQHVARVRAASPANTHAHPPARHTATQSTHAASVPASVSPSSSSRAFTGHTSTNTNANSNANAIIATHARAQTLKLHKSAPCVPLPLPTTTSVPLVAPPRSPSLPKRIFKSPPSPPRRVPSRPASPSPSQRASPRPASPARCPPCRSPSNTRASSSSATLTASTHNARTSPFSAFTAVPAGPTQTQGMDMATVASVSTVHHQPASPVCQRAKDTLARIRSLLARDNQDDNRDNMHEDKSYEYADDYNRGGPVTSLFSIPPSCLAPASTGFEEGDSDAGTEYTHTETISTIHAQPHTQAQAERNSAVGVNGDTHGSMGESMDVDAAISALLHATLALHPRSHTHSANTQAQAYAHPTEPMLIGHGETSPSLRTTLDKSKVEVKMVENVQRGPFQPPVVGASVMGTAGYNTASVAARGASGCGEESADGEVQVEVKNAYLTSPPLLTTPVKPQSSGLVPISSVSLARLTPLPPLPPLPILTPTSTPGKKAIVARNLISESVKDPSLSYSPSRMPTLNTTLKPLPKLELPVFTPLPAPKHDHSSIFSPMKTKMDE